MMCRCFGVRSSRYSSGKTWNSQRSRTLGGKLASSHV
jgi:hypothetical protein